MVHNVLYMYILASLYTQYFVKCFTQDSQVDWPMANGTILLKIKIHSFIQHYEPKPFVITEKFYFHRRDQGTNESIAKYIVEL